MLPTTLKWHEPASATAAEDPATPLPLTKSNFVDVLVAALEAIKAEARNEHNVNITSAVATKPDWVFNDLDRLVEEACLKADIGAFTLNNRVEAAVRVATRAGKQKVLLLEQTGYNFNMHEASSTPNAEARGSMSRNELSAAWIPRRLAEELLQAAILEEPAAARCDAGAQTRLVQEISKARALHRLQSGPDVGPGHDTWVIVRKLVEGFTLDKPLLGESIAQVEREYVDAVQEAVEDMLRKNHDIWEYLKEHDKMISIPTQCPQPMLTSPPRSLYQRHTTGHPDDACQRSRNRKHHPRSPEIKSWYKPIDSLIILADLPDSPLLVTGGRRGLCASPGWAKDGFVNWDHDVAAKGAALDAMQLLRGWEEERQWQRCQEDESQCADEEWEGDESGRDDEVGHGEL